ncbi:MAG: methyltransferase [Cyanobacteria bacterium P01_H01_bin.35]
MSETQGKIMDLIFGRWRSQILHAGVKLGIFDSLQNNSKKATVIAEELRLDPKLTYRLLRSLGSLELLNESGEHTFSLTEAGQLLKTDHPESLRGITLLEEGPHHYALWKHLPAMVKEGKQNAFVREFGDSAFEYAVRDATYAEVFDEAMSSFSTIHSGWVLDALQAYDFSQIAHICDVGGGHGYMLSSFLAKYPHLRGTVLELESVIANDTKLWAAKLGVEERCQYLAGDMFKAVPSADAYIMKMILHDWNDEECVHILDYQRKATPSGGRVFIAEHIIPDPSTPHFAKLFDIHMMCWGTGRERTQEEYAALLERAGWKYMKTWFPSSGLMGVVEGLKA